MRWVTFFGNPVVSFTPLSSRPGRWMGWQKAKSGHTRPEAKRSQGKTQGDGSQHYHRVAPETMTGLCKELGCRLRASCCPVLSPAWPRRAKAKVACLSGPMCLLLGARCSRLTP